MIKKATNMNTCGAILSGGKSSRMGTNKSLLTIDNQPIIQKISEELKQCNDEVIVVSNQHETYDFLGVKQVSDRYIDKGPLAGLETALYHVNADVYMFAACDMPFISSEVYKFLLQQLAHYDAVVPIYNNQMHPLAGIYKKSVLPQIQSQIEKNNLKVMGFFAYVNVIYVRDFGNLSDELLQKHFFNMNYPAQYKEAKRL